MVYFLIQVFLPMRYVFYPSQLFWSEEGFRFSWRVMLVEKAGYARFFVKSEQSNAKFEIDEERYLTAFQRKMMCTQPDMILQYAHFLKDKQIERGIINPEIYAEVYSTLNGRSSELLINPDVDLAKEKDSFLPQKWILKRNDY
jgi:hypothetical protein